MKSTFALAVLVGIWITTVLIAQDSIVGIGVSLSADSETGDLKIAKVVPAGSADNAGVKPGLILRKVDDVEMIGKKMADCVALIRGPIGSKVKLELVNPADNTTRRFEITRDKIVVGAPVRANRGDPAAPLKIKEWVKGGPLDVHDGKNVYVVEFWATWCPPCRTSIPHLAELQKRFKNRGVVIVGIS